MWKYLCECVKDAEVNSSWKLFIGSAVIQNNVESGSFH